MYSNTIIVDNRTNKDILVRYSRYFIQTNEYYLQEVTGYRHSIGDICIVMLVMNLIDACKDIY